jgi:hypothetical protein
MVVLKKSFILLKIELGPQNGGRYRQVVAIRMWLLAQV